MGATTGRWSRRAIPRLLAVLVLLLAVSGAAPGPRAGAAEKNPPGDPPGNNGTIKVVASDPSDPDPGNEPQLDTCLLWLEFYGFDEGQTADITFTAQPPSGNQELLADNGVAISDDAAGGGQDKDAVIGYNLTSAVQGLKEHPKQGFHIKVRSDTREAPGGAKQKVFWMKCSPAEPTTLRVSKGVEGAGSGPFGFEVRCNHRPLDATFTLEAGGKHDVTGVPAGTTCIATETDAKGATETRTAENPPDGSDDGQMKLAAGTPGTVTFTNVFPGTGGTPAPDAETAVLGERVTRTDLTPADTTLPRTGGDPVSLVAAGLWSLSAGGLVLAAVRRRR